METDKCYYVYFNGFDEEKDRAIRQWLYNRREVKFAEIVSLVRLMYIMAPKDTVNKMQQKFSWIGKIYEDKAFTEAY